jgi:hypothetical protein
VACDNDYRSGRVERNSFTAKRLSWKIIFVKNVRIFSVEISMFSFGGVQCVLSVDIY